MVKGAIPYGMDVSMSDGTIGVFMDISKGGGNVPYLGIDLVLET